MMPFPKGSTIALLVLGLSATSLSAFASPYDDAIQCSAFIQLTVQSQPANAPGVAQAMALKQDWEAYAETISFPQTVDVKRDVASETVEIQRKMMEFQGDMSKVEPYMRPIGARCGKPPPDTIAPELCKAIANGEHEAASLGVDMHRYNLSLQSGEEAMKSRAGIKKEEQNVAEAKRAMAHFDSAGKFTLNAETQSILLDHDARKAAYQTCLQQMG